MAVLKLYTGGAIGETDFFFLLFGSEKSLGDVNNTDDTIKAIRASAGKFDSIELTIADCPGGSVHQAVGMFEVLRGQGVPVITRTVGMCASAATILLAAGDQRFSTPFCKFLVHEGRYERIEYAPAGELRKAADSLDAVNAEIADIYVAATGGKKSKEDWLALMNEDKFVSASVMQDFGLVTEISQYVPLNTADISQQFNILKIMSDKPKGLLEQLFGGGKTVEAVANTTPTPAEAPATPPAPVVEAVTKAELDAVLAKFEAAQAENKEVLTELAKRDAAKAEALASAEKEIAELKAQLAAKTVRNEQLAALPEAGRMAAPENVAKTVAKEANAPADKQDISAFVNVIIPQKTR